MTKFIKRISRGKLTRLSLHKFSTCFAPTFCVGLKSRRPINSDFGFQVLCILCDLAFVNFHSSSFHLCFAHSDLKSIERTAHRVFGPRPLITIPKQRAIGMQFNQSFGDVGRTLSEIYDSRHIFHFRFGRIKNPTRILGINVTRFNAKDFLRSTTRIVSNSEQRSKCLVVDERQHEIELLWRDNSFATTRRWGRQRGDWTMRDMPLLSCPMKATFHRSNIVPFRGWRMSDKGIGPALNMKRLKITHPEILVEFNESLKTRPVPLECIRRTVFRNPFKKRIADNGQRLGRNPSLFGLPHKLIKAVESISLIWTEAVLHTTQGNKPLLSRLTIPRLRATRH
jgi:hypothetical protein